MAIEAINSNSVGFKQVAKPNMKSSQNFTSKPDVDEEKSNATKYMIGATALAAVIGLGIAGYEGKLGKTVQEFLGGAEKATKNLAEKAVNEHNEVKHDMNGLVDWDAKPISRKQALFEGKYPKDRRIFYINPEIDKDFEALRKKGYTINVKNLSGKKVEIEYIYPEKSPIKSKIIRGKVADLENGYDWQANDVKEVTLNLKENSNSYTLSFNNHTKVGEAPYEFAASNELSYSDLRGSIDKKDLFDRIITPRVTKDGNTEASAKMLVEEFKKELGL